MKAKKIISALLGIMLLSSSLPAFAADNISQIIGDGNTVIFVDVPSDYWAKDQIDYFAQQGIVAGYEDGSFRPEDGVTREEFCKLLVSTFQQPLETPPSPTFSDVHEDRWSYPYVEVCSDFLTGYTNPFGGLPAFHPTEFAAREDIAVALVRMMGFTDSDAKNKNYAAQQFKDGGSISPNLLPYVSLACEKGLINGYPDGTFGPGYGITRAETVVLLNRATKQAVTNINAALELSANVIYSTDGKTATINIICEQGATVKVNGETVKMSSNFDDKYEGNYVYKFEAEGSKDFTVEATKAGKSKTVTVTAKYEIGAPVLSITNCPTTSDYQTATIKGTVKDTKDSRPAVTINGRSVYVSSGSWEEKVDLAEGDNKFTIVATNSSGKTTTEVRSIRFGVGAPTLKITSCPTTSDYQTATIRGTVKDANDSYPTVTINGRSVYVSSGSWEEKVDLAEGDNKFTIVATNSLGKTTTEVRSIRFGVGAPTLKITSCPTTSDYQTATIRGTVKDANDSYPTVTINGQSVYVSSGSWEKKVDLTEGDNKFTIVATNSLGKTTTEERSIQFGVGAPTLKVTSCPATSDEQTATIRGTVKDANDSYPTVTINGQSVYVSSGSWEKKVDLTEGDNKFTIVATNSLGKTATEERSIHFAAGSPEILFTNCPEVTQQKNLSIQGKVKGQNAGAKLYINDQEVSIGYSGDFYKSVTLTEGDNSFVFRAINSYGKSTSVAKTIRYVGEIKAPALDVDDVSSTSAESEITVTGSVNDALDPNVAVYVNDKRITSGNGGWSTTVSLSEGSNDIIIVATNSYGKSTTVVKQVRYTTPAAEE